ncbi:MAG: hypothetical protein H7Z40_12330 [Phycisphaerae bacterium]|nr:hypothetical protein [Gemmatimonadaceae bacterium]
MRRKVLTPLCAALAFAVLASGCVLQRGGGGTMISSASSDYSPVVSFSAEVSVTDSVRIVIDRMGIVAPGEVFEGATASTGRIEMQALLVNANPNANGGGVDSDRNGTRKSWLERSASANIGVADSLVMGVPQTSGPHRFALPLPTDINRSESWLVFRITGPAKAMAARMADGSEPPVITLPSIRVFACSVKNLDGKTDQARARVMAESYLSAC